MSGGARLPGTPDDEGEDPVVLHVDMDCFYAACERRREPELEGEPVVVGMGYEDGRNHGAVATASYEAREYGVESAQAISTALERLPRMAEAQESDSDVDPDEAGYYRPVDMDYYQSVGQEVKDILHDSADVVREVSIDEAYLDVTDRTSWEVAEGFARHVKHRIDREVGVTASVGVAPNMSAAKIASDFDKPDGLVVVEPGEVREFLAPLDVVEIHGVGPVTARKLREMGIETAGDLADADRGDLEESFGERGAEMHRRARGEDDREVTPTGRPKSLSRESAFTESTDDDGKKREQVRALAEAVADRASRKGVMYRTIGIKAVTPPYDVNTRAKSLPGPVDDRELVEEVALDLLTEFEGDPVRKVGVRVSNLSFADADQASLGQEWDPGEVDGASVSEADGASSGEADSASPSEAADSDETPNRDAPPTDLTEFDGDGSDDRSSSSDRGGSSDSDEPTESTLDSTPNGQLSLEDGWEVADGGGDGSATDEDAQDSDADPTETGPTDADANSDGQSSLTDF